MVGRLRLLALPLLLVLAPSAALALIGFKWLRLEHLQEVQRSREAALVEGARLRDDLVTLLASVTRQTASAWRVGEASSRPFATPPLLSDLVTAAYRFEPAGTLVAPDYVRTYRDQVRRHETAIARPKWRRELDLVTADEVAGNHAQARRRVERLLPAADGIDVEATVRLAAGRLALAEADFVAAEEAAQELLSCCAAARDEYGVSFAFYAAAQFVAAWRPQGVLRARFGHITDQLGRLLDTGVIGHPADVPQAASLVESAGRQAESQEFLARAERAAQRITGWTAAGRELERWVAATTLLGSSRQGFVLSTLRSDARPRLVGVLRESNGQYLALSFSIEHVSGWVSAQASDVGRFDARVSVSGIGPGEEAVRVPLSPDVPGIDLVLRPRSVDPAVQRNRAALFGGLLAAAAVLVLIVAWLTVRDISRELRVASLRANFVAGVTHELKTPLTSIRLLAETLRLKRTRDSAAAEELLGAIVSESERLTQLLDNVLGFARIDRGEQPYRPEEVDFESAVDSALARLRYILEQGGFRLIVERSATRLRVCVDSEALIGAVANLVGNAAKYSGTSREIRLAIDVSERHAELRVTDFGIGISPADRRRVFDRFYRTTEATREAGGAGLGLALVRHFAEAHGGQVAVASDPGRSTTFTLRLPLASGPSPVPQPLEDGPAG